MTGNGDDGAAAARHPDPGSRIPDPETRNLKLVTRNPKQEMEMTERRLRDILAEINAQIDAMMVKTPANYYFLHPEP